MSAPYDGGAAFPSTEPDQEHTPYYDYHHGMTLRDYFAAKAMQSILTHDDWSPDKAAEWAYLTADSMLKAREKR